MSSNIDNINHTGIVEKVEGGTVYTIEGNSGDKVCENQYSIGNKEILGYGFYSGNNTVATGDTAQQVWTYLKSYGYSDSVAAGIIGNMMRECGGDTLNLDWNIVGHYNGDDLVDREIIKELEREIKAAIERGYTTFISGMARGDDIWAAEIVLKLRK